MFENATNLKIRPGLLDEAVRILRAAVVPYLRSQPGLLSLALIPQRGSSTVTILTIWESAACARSVEALSGYRQGIRQLDPLLEQSTYTAPSQIHGPMERHSLSPN